jgi:uncharacterized protein YpmS
MGLQASKLHRLSVSSFSIGALSVPTDKNLKDCDQHIFGLYPEN